MPTSLRPSVIHTKEKKINENGKTTSAYHNKMEKDGEYKNWKLFKPSTEIQTISTRLQTSWSNFYKNNFKRRPSSFEKVQILPGIKVLVLILE